MTRSESLQARLLEIRAQREAGRCEQNIEFAEAIDRSRDRLLDLADCVTSHETANASPPLFAT